MKKMNVLLAALALAITAITPLASSASDTEPAIEVSATFDTSYTITIPDGIQEIKEGTPFNVSASGCFEYGETVSIYVESTNGWKLKDKNHSDNKADIPYSVTNKDSKTPLGEGKNNILEFTVNDDVLDGETIMTVSEIKAPTYAGTYGDKLTFTAKTVKPKKDNEDAEPANTAVDVTLVKATSTTTTTTTEGTPPTPDETETTTTEGGEGT